MLLACVMFEFVDFMIFLYEDHNRPAVYYMHPFSMILQEAKEGDFVLHLRDHDDQLYDGHMDWQQ